MIPWIELDRATLPQGGELRLMRRGHEFSIKIGVAELMTSRLNASEAALATLAAETLNGRTKPRILIGGLGMGFTLRAALGALGEGAVGMGGAAATEIEVAAVTGQTVVLTATTTVVRTVLSAGQDRTVGWQEMTVLVVVEKTVLVVSSTLWVALMTGGVVRA